MEWATHCLVIFLTQFDTVGKLGHLTLLFDVSSNVAFLTVTVVLTNVIHCALAQTEITINPHQFFSLEMSAQT